MRVTVRLYAGLTRYGPHGPAGEAFDCSLPEGGTVHDLLCALGVPDHAPVVALVQHQVVELDHPLADGDVLALFPPVAGG